MQNGRKRVRNTEKISHVKPSLYSARLIFSQENTGYQPTAIQTILFSIVLSMP